MPKRWVQGLPGKILTFLVVTLLTVLAILGIHGAFAGDESGAVRTVGWVEKVSMQGVEPVLKAKLDTGANTTSINAEVLEKPDENVESGGIVKFYFVDKEGNKTLFERPLVRWVKIKGESRRPVINMGFCMAGEWIEGEVNLSERDDFNYAVLVGRNLLKKGRLAVDSSQTFVTQRVCSEGDQSQENGSEENSSEENTSQENSSQEGSQESGS